MIWWVICENWLRNSFRNEQNVRQPQILTLLQYVYVAELNFGTLTEWVCLLWPDNIVRYTDSSLTILRHSLVKLMFILCFGSSRNVFYLFEAIGVVCSSNPCYAHAWLYKGLWLLYGIIRTLQ